VVWIYVVEFGYHWRAVVNTVVNLWVPLNVEKFL